MLRAGLWQQGGESDTFQRGLAKTQPSAHRVPPPVPVLVFAADAQALPAHSHHKDEAAVGDKESHEGAPLARHVEEQPVGGVQLHLQGEVGPAGTGG